MQCEVIEELISAALDGEATAEEQRQIDEHLATCAACRQAMTDLQAAQSLSRSIGVTEAPFGFRQRVMQRIETQPSHSWAFWHWPRLAYGLAALSLLVGLTLFWRLERQPSNAQWQQYASTAVDVYAEDLLFEEDASSTTEWLPQETDNSDSAEEAAPSTTEWQPQESEHVAEELLNSIDFGETGAHLSSPIGAMAAVS